MEAALIQLISNKVQINTITKSKTPNNMGGNVGGMSTLSSSPLSLEAILSVACWPFRRAPA